VSNQAKKDEVAEVLWHTLRSQSVCDINGEDANVVDGLQGVASCTRLIARAITADGVPGSLTQAVMGIPETLALIADAINNLAEAVRETRVGP
jgi:hypothetical protein